MSHSKKISFDIHEYIPKSWVCFKEGYSSKTLLSDLLAGLSVGVIALPLAMAFAIGSGVPPERGLFTAIVAGFLISLLGGSRVQIGGPTGAFVVIVYSVIQKHGYEGLAIATILAGVMMMLMGLFRCGALLKFIPYPVTTGFTTGIALTIFSSQIKDFFGLQMGAVPADFIEKWMGYFHHFHTVNFYSAFLAAGTLILIFFLRAKVPRFPGAILAISLATLLAYFLDFPVETIESKFGEIPRTLPLPTVPVLSFEKIQQVFPSAVTIALLGAIESLLCAVVADGLTGHKHRSNVELVAQGIANIVSIFFGGICATGAIARTTANINMGGKTPLAGILHAITLLFLMLIFAPLAAKIPLASLAAVLIFVSWNMSELGHFISILKQNKSDALVLCITFFLTVLIDLTVAVQVGVILAAILFMKKMTDSTTLRVSKMILNENEAEIEEKGENILLRQDVPENVTVFEIQGPFFFGISDQLNETLRTLNKNPRIFILRMRHVPLIDASGVQALKQFYLKCQKLNILFLMSGVQPQVKEILTKSGVVDLVGTESFFPHIDHALEFARRTDKEITEKESFSLNNTAIVSEAQ